MRKGREVKSDNRVTREVFHWEAKARKVNSVRNYWRLTEFNRRIHENLFFQRAQSRDIVVGGNLLDYYTTLFTPMNHPVGGYFRGAGCVEGAD